MPHLNHSPIDVLPETITSLFTTSLINGLLTADFYNSLDANEVERELAEYGVSYRTRIMRTRRKGVIYRIVIYYDG